MKALDKPLGMTEQEVLNCIHRSIHWPMECALTPAALAEVETAVLERLRLVRGGPLAKRVQAELTNLASNIRAHLQHVVADARRAPTDEDLLK